MPISTIQNESNTDCLIWKSPVHSITIGSQIIVHENEEALLFEYDHEYRSVSRQVSFIALEGDTAVAEEDEYCRWWILKGG